MTPVLLPYFASSDEMCAFASPCCTSYVWPCGHLEKNDAFGKPRCEVDAWLNKKSPFVVGSCVSDGLQTLQVEIYTACNIGGSFASYLVKFSSPFLGGRVEIWAAWK